MKPSLGWDVLCLDKTGTITQGNMRVDHMIPFVEEARIMEAGSAFVGALMENNSTFLALKGFLWRRLENPLYTALPLLLGAEMEFLPPLVKRAPYF